MARRPGRGPGRGSVPLAVIVSLLVASSLGAAVPPAAGQTTTDEARVERVHGPDRVATALALSRRVFATADTVVLARADDFADALAGAPLARALRAPLLLTSRTRLSPGVVDEVRRLGAGEVVLLGGPGAIRPEVPQALPDDLTVRRVFGRSREATAVAVADELDPVDTIYLTARDRFPDALAAGPLASHTGRPILLTHTGTLSPATADALERLRPARVVVLGGPAAVSDEVLARVRGMADEVERSAGPYRYATAAKLFDAAVEAGLSPRQVWLATGDTFPDALAAGPAVAHAGGVLLLVPGRDLRRANEPIARLRAHPVRRVFVVGGPAAVTTDAHWQVPVTRHAPFLPRGGLTLFPDFRLVAFYGNAESPAMGVLGEQPPDEAYDRLWRQARPYRVAGRPLQPTFELIVSIATSSPGADGDYSRPTDPALVERWLAAARRHDTYLLLDIQPGRSEFLPEVRRYERFLREPDVGVALDPEWRMGPDERPAETVGSVDAAEVNEVVDYLAGIVREERLPQKLLVVHQFRTDMVTNRARIRRPAELALVFHMDGHGSRAQKLDTYRYVHVDPGNGAFNGFKLFYDEDRDMFAPSELLRDVRPVPDLISYQ